MLFEFIGFFESIKSGDAGRTGSQKQMEWGCDHHLSELSEAATDLGYEQGARSYAAS